MKKWTPHDYQLRGMRILTQQEDGGAGLFLDPGMGKTTVALGAFEILRDAGLATKMLVIAPIKPMYDTWPREPKKWTDFCHLRVGVVHGSLKNKTKVLQGDYDIYVINPESLGFIFHDNTAFLNDIDIVCVDESTKFKNTTSKRFKLLKKQLQRISYRWILTGTVVPNGLEDLFGQVYIMDQGATLGKYITHFRNNYFYPSGYGGYKYKPHKGATEEVAKLIAPRTLSLQAEDYLDMPEFLPIKREVLLTEKALKTYKEVEQDFISKVSDENVVAANAAAAGTKCRQIANGAVYFNYDHEWKEVHMEKLRALDEIVEETNGKPLLIFYEFDHDRERIMDMLGDEAECLTGLTSRKLTQVTRKFNEGELRFLVAHSGSMHGLNIQGACHHMVWFGLPWNLENYIQAVRRLYRQGQMSETVMCYHLIAKGTLDEKVVEVLDHKKNEQDKLNQLLEDYAKAS